MKELIIQRNDSGQRIDKFLQKHFASLPLSTMFKAIRKKDIKINGKRCYPDTILEKNDVVRLYVEDEFLIARVPETDFLGADSALTIVYEDSNMIITDKPLGVLSHADENEYVDTQIAKILKHLYLKREYRPKAEQSFTPALVNRLDRNTSGLIIAAKNAESLRELNSLMREQCIKRFYLCLVYGEFKNESQTLNGFLHKDKKTNRVTISKTQDNKDSRKVETKFNVVSSKNGYSLVEVELKTGRSHQIRAHLSSIGFPIVGDRKYGYVGKKKKLALCSYKLCFEIDNKNSPLAYLDKRIFISEHIWFFDAFSHSNF